MYNNYDKEGRILIRCQVLPCFVSGRNYQLEVVLRSYENPKNQVSSGLCCEARNESPQCSGKCDPFFTINETSSDTTYTTPVYPNTASISFPNTVYTFYGNDSTWPVSSHYNIYVLLYRHPSRVDICRITDINPDHSPYTSIIPQLLKTPHYNIGPSSVQLRRFTLHLLPKL